LYFRKTTDQIISKTNQHSHLQIGVAMAINTDDFIKDILDSISKIDYINPQDVPNIELYMDQITTFMDNQLEASKRYPDDKILTKTMINNYTKNKLIPPPVKKKYSKEHILLLIFIYYFKNILSINDIQNLLGPITDRFFNSSNDFKLEDIYNEVFSLGEEQVNVLKQDIRDKYSTSQQTFEDVPEKDREFLKSFSFICLLSFDVYIKKQLIESLIDELPAKQAKKDKKSSEGQDK